MTTQHTELIQLSDYQRQILLHKLSEHQLSIKALLTALTAREKRITKAQIESILVTLSNCLDVVLN